MPAAIASRQVTPPVECTSTSAAASNSGILSVNPYTCTCATPVNDLRSLRASESLRPARQTMLVTSGTATNSLTAPVMSPTPQPPPDTTTMRPCSGSPSARRAASGLRSCRNSEEISGRTSRTLPSPAMRSTGSSDSP